MKKIETLKDGSNVLIRELSLDDLDRLMNFYQGLPEDDRKYLRVDVTDRAVVSKRIRLIESGKIIRIVAFHEDAIVADGALELSPDEWNRHVGELRVIVDRKFQRRGLGMLLMRELYFLAARKKVEKLVVRMMRPQEGARKICRRLGFHDETILPDYARDVTGKPQDLVIMTCNMNEFWKDLEEEYEDSDWRRHR